MHCTFHHGQHILLVVVDKVKEKIFKTQQHCRLSLRLRQVMILLQKQASKERLKHLAHALSV